MIDTYCDNCQATTPQEYVQDHFTFSQWDSLDEYLDPDGTICLMCNTYNGKEGNDAR